MHVPVLAPASGSGEMGKYWRSLHEQTEASTKETQATPVSAELLK